MARRNQNTFLKRQKELKRVRKAKEKMARRHGKEIVDAYTFEGPPPSQNPPETPPTESIAAAENEKTPQDDAPTDS